MQGSYGNGYDARQHKINEYYLDQMNLKTVSKSNLTPIRQTNASKLLRENHHHRAEQSRPLFKMNRFKQVGSCVHSQSQSQSNFNLK